MLLLVRNAVLGLKGRSYVQPPNKQTERNGVAERSAWQWITR
jgi:hypothetical protein